MSAGGGSAVTVMLKEWRSFIVCDVAVTGSAVMSPAYICAGVPAGTET